MKRDDFVLVFIHAHFMKKWMMSTSSTKGWIKGTFLTRMETISMAMSTDIADDEELENRHSSDTGRRQPK